MRKRYNLSVLREGGLYFKHGPDRSGKHLLGSTYLYIDIESTVKIEQKVRSVTKSCP